MTTIELRNEIEELTRKCDESDEQQAVKAVLLSLLGAIYSKREIPLMCHVRDFSRAELTRMRALRN